MDAAKLFAVIRRLKGEGLTQAEVDEINAALTYDDEIIVTASAPRARTSAKGLTAMRQHEGCKLTAYPDPGSRDGHPWTIGYGATGQGITKGVVWAQEQADQRFAADVTKREPVLAALLGSAPTTQNQWDALMSFGYNVGMGDGGLKTSTLLRKHKEGDIAGAAKEFARWNKNDGKAMAGLTKRRAAEAALYLS